VTGVAEQLATALVGLVSGVLAGLFGIGGGLVTTPAIRLVLGYPELVAVGTPLMVIVPTAVTGAVSYARRGSADVRAGLTVGLWGSVTAILGALVATWCHSRGALGLAVDSCGPRAARASGFRGRAAGGGCCTGSQ
jgi:uncharacterized membrane protein YfcA